MRGGNTAIAPEVREYPPSSCFWRSWIHGSIARASRTALPSSRLPAQPGAPPRRCRGSRPRAPGGCSKGALADGAGKGEVGFEQEIQGRDSNRDEIALEGSSAREDSALVILKILKGDGFRAAGEKVARAVMIHENDAN